MERQARSPAGLRDRDGHRPARCHDAPVGAERRNIVGQGIPGVAQIIGNAGDAVACPVTSHDEIAHRDVRGERHAQGGRGVAGVIVRLNVTRHLGQCLH